MTVLDYDGETAPANLQRLLEQLSGELRARLFICISTRGTGRHVYLRTAAPIRTTVLRDPADRRIGDVKGVGAYVVAPTPDRIIAGDLASLPILDDGERAAILTLVGYQEAPERPTHAIVDWARAEAAMQRIDALWTRIKPHTLTYQHLHGDGGPDRSARRYGVACELRRRFGLPNDEIAALLWTFHWGHLQEKRRRGLTADIERCIARAEAAYPTAITSPTRALWGTTATPTPAQPALPTPISRPRAMRWEDMRARLDDLRVGDHVPMTVGDLAELWDVPRTQIERAEREGRASGAMRREVSRDRRTSWIVLQDLTTDTFEGTEIRSNAAAVDMFEGTVQSIEMPQTRSSHAHVVEKHTPATEPDPAAPSAQPVADVAIADASVVPAACVSPPTPTVPVLRDVVADLVRAAVGQRWGRIVGYVRTAYPDAPWSDEAIRWHVDAERRRLRDDAQAERIAVMTMGDLRRAIAACERSVADSHRRGTKTHRFWVYRLRLLNAERDRRVVALQARVMPQAALPLFVSSARTDKPVVPVAAPWLAHQRRLSGLGDLRR